MMNFLRTVCIAIAMPFVMAGMAIVFFLEMMQNRKIK